MYRLPRLTIKPPVASLRTLTCFDGSPSSREDLMTRFSAEELQLTGLGWSPSRYSELGVEKCEQNGQLETGCEAKRCFLPEEQNHTVKLCRAESPETPKTSYSGAENTK